jgi:ribosome-associated protein
MINKKKKIKKVSPLPVKKDNKAVSKKKIVPVKENKKVTKKKLAVKQTRAQYIHPLVDTIVWAAFKKKASDVTIIDLKGKSSVADYFIICSAESGAQIRAIRDSVKVEAKNINEKPWHVEDGETWTLMDYVDVVVHIFDSQTRAYYNLERLWGDAKVIICNEKDYL